MLDPDPILIRTKLAPPRIGKAPVSRERLVDALDARQDHRLCVVQGPAGSGKTMLLTQLRQRLVKRGGPRSHKPQPTAYPPASATSCSS